MIKAYKIISCDLEVGFILSTIETLESLGKDIAQDVRHFPLKLMRLAILHNAGLPVPNGIVVSISNDGEAGSHAFEEAVSRFGTENLILRGIDDDLPWQAGATNSPIAKRAQFTRQLSEMAMNVEAHADVLRRKNSGHLLGYFEIDMLRDMVFTGEAPAVSELPKVTLLQKFEPRSHSGTFLIDDKYIVVGYFEGNGGPTKHETPTQVVLNKKGRIISGALPESVAVEIARMAEKIQKALLPYELGSPNWVIEYCANLFEPSDLGMTILQARPIAVPSEPEVDPVVNPEVFRFGSYALPLSGKVVRIECRDDLAKVKYDSIVVSPLCANVDFRNLKVEPRAILMDGGGAGQHNVLVTKSIGCLVAKPDFFAELAEGQSVMIGVNGRTGKLYVKKGEGPADISKKEQITHQTGELIFSEEAEFDRIVVSNRELLGATTIHPDRTEDVIDSDLGCYVTTVNGVKLILATDSKTPEKVRREFSCMNNATLLSMLKGPLRYGFAVYADQNLLIGMEMDNPHGSMSSRFEKYAGKLTLTTSSRLFNHEGHRKGYEVYNTLVPRTSDRLTMRFFNTCYGDDDESLPEVNPEKLIARLLILKRLNISFSDCSFMFQKYEGSFDYIELASKMAGAGQFTRDACHQILGMIPVQDGDKTIFISRYDYRNCMRQYAQNGMVDLQKTMYLHFAKEREEGKALYIQKLAENVYSISRSKLDEKTLPRLCSALQMVDALPE